MVVRGRGGASLAVHPARIAGDVVFLLPDGHAMFHFIDDEAAGTECLVAMRGADADPYRDIADGERAHAVHTRGARDPVSLDGLGHDARAFLLGELRERLVLEARDRETFVVIAHPAFEPGESAARVVAHLSRQRRGVERAGAESKRRAHPPATGGMNTTAS